MLIPPTPPTSSTKSGVSGRFSEDAIADEMKVACAPVSTARLTVTGKFVGSVGSP